MEPVASNFQYFSRIHLYTFIVSVAFSCILIFMPKLLKSLNRKKYGTFLGFLILGFKLFDSIYRVTHEYEPVYNVFPIHLCNFAAIAAGLYLIFKTGFLFNLAYFLSFGAAFALILPGVTIYYNSFYVYIFMTTHALEFVAVIYGFLYLDGKVTFKGYMLASMTLVGLFAYAAVYNRFFDVNAMFLRDYIAGIVSFIKPFSLYIVVLISSMLFIMYLMYIPFREKK